MKKNNNIILLILTGILIIALTVGLNNLSPASIILPSVGTINVACETGASCNLAGDNWIVDMLVTTSASKPNIKLTLPSGISSITSSGETWKTQGAVSVSLLDKGATLSVPTSQISNSGCGGTIVPSLYYNQCNRNSYYVWQAGGVTADAYQIPVYRPTQFSNVVTTHYTISVDSPSGNLGNQEVSYNYLSPTSVTFTDNQGNNAVISPKYQTNQGVNAEVSGRVFVYDGISKYYLFNEAPFTDALYQTWYEQQHCGFLSTPCLNSWNEWFNKIKTIETPLTMANSASISAKTGNNMIVSYPPGSIGTSVQAVISKRMASSIQVIQSFGIPRIDSASATSAIKGSSVSTLTVKVTNTNTAGSDNFQVTSNAESNGFTARITKAPVGNILSGGQQGTWVFELTPSGMSQSSTVPLTATATSSGGQDTKAFTVDVTVPVGPNPNPTGTVTQTPPVTTETGTFKNWYETTGGLLLIISAFITLILTFWYMEKRK